MNRSFELAPGQMLFVASNAATVWLSLTEKGLPLAHIVIPRRIFRRIVAAFLREWADILFPEEGHES